MKMEELLSNILSVWYGDPVALSSGIEVATVFLGN